MIQIEPVEPGSSLIRWDLLRMADPSDQSIKSYLNESVIFVGKVAGKPQAILVLKHRENEVEILNLAVDPTHQGCGHGRKMIEVARQAAMASGAHRLTVATGNSSFDQLRLYQRCGFRMESIERNYFESYDPPIYENGVRCYDRVLLSMDLQT